MNPYTLDWFTSIDADITTVDVDDNSQRDVITVWS